MSIKAFPKDTFRVKVIRFYRHKNYMRQVTKFGPISANKDDYSGFQFTDEKYAVHALLYYKDSKVPLLSAWSRCNKMDQPNRKEGVRIAIERLEKAARANGFI